VVIKIGGASAPPNLGGKMKYQVLRNCVIDGAPRKAKSIVEISDAEAKALLGIGRIAPYDEPKVENRAIALDESSEAPKKRTYTKKKK
jgi:hypothetical protein